MNFVNNERVLRLNIAILKPATRNTGGDNDNIPRR